MPLRLAGWQLPPLLKPAAFSPTSFSVEEGPTTGAKHCPADHTSAGHSRHLSSSVPPHSPHHHLLPTVLCQTDKPALLLSHSSHIAGIS